MGKKYLVTYATRAGSTAEIAQRIGKILIGRGASVDVRPINAVADIQDYHAVIIGGGVRFGQWMSDAVKFVEKNQKALSQMPTAFFAVHLLNLDDDEVSRKNRLAYLEPARRQVTPVSEALFAGVGDFRKVSLAERLLSKAVKSPEGDLRDWQAIETWAETLADTL